MVKVPHALVGLENVPLRRGLEGGGGYESAPGNHSGQSAARTLVVASCDMLQVQLVSWANCCSSITQKNKHFATKSSNEQIEKSA